MTFEVTCQRITFGVGSESTTGGRGGGGSVGGFALPWAGGGEGPGTAGWLLGDGIAQRPEKSAPARLSTPEVGRNGKVLAISGVYLA
ncbi:hypothetical protein F0U60_05480 [Archangium minus]|uniref:Uncharacterized protein n=1 Tax=Archangium minus TaxID=83450 RepID=A0ABY9WII2_9BACT|nr:hypothetical protein F0U60_05480 [Archangium minus]